VTVKYGYLTKNISYSSITTAEISYLRSIKGCSRLDCLCNEDTRQEVNVIPITGNIDIYTER
jgi:hypothetical protein